MLMDKLSNVFVADGPDEAIKGPAAVDKATLEVSSKHPHSQQQNK